MIRLRQNTATIILATVLCLVSSCKAEENPGASDDRYTKTSVFVSDETFLEGQTAELTSILVDDASTPLADKRIRVVISPVRTVYGITKEDGIAIIPLDPIKAGTYPCRAFFDGDREYYSSWYDFTITVLPTKSTK